MVTLAERLEKTGVSLAGTIGVIIKVRDEDGAWYVSRAMYTRMCNDSESYPHDPKHSLLLDWKRNGNSRTIAVNINKNADITDVCGGGLSISTPDLQVSIGQSLEFRDSVYIAWCTMPKCIF